MDHIVLVEVVNRAENLLDGAGRIFFCKLSLVANPVKQLSSSSQLRNDVESILLVISEPFHRLNLLDRLGYSRFEPVNKFDDVRMLEHSQHANLIIQHVLVALEFLLQNDLDGDLARWAIGLPNHAVRARPEGPAKAIICPLQRCQELSRIIALVLAGSLGVHFVGAPGGTTEVA